VEVHLGRLGSSGEEDQVGPRLPGIVTVKLLAGRVVQDIMHNSNDAIHPASLIGERMFA